MRMPVVIWVMPLLLFLICHSSINMSGQTTIAILPVSTHAAGTSLLSEEQWRGVALSLQDYLAINLSKIGVVSKLSREHLLLLLKDMPPPNPENLSKDAYQRISRKENLHYIFRLNIQSVQVKDLQVIVLGNILVVEGSSGAPFWEKTLRWIKNMQYDKITEPVMTSEILKPMLDQVMKEILELNY